MHWIASLLAVGIGAGCYFYLRALPFLILSMIVVAILAIMNWAAVSFAPSAIEIVGFAILMQVGFVIGLAVRANVKIGVAKTAAKEDRRHSVFPKSKP